MKKKIMSLVLVLTMILSLAVANMSLVGAEEPANQVNFRYYCDGAMDDGTLSSSEEIKKVELGDYFYVRMSLKNFEALGSFGFALEYDKNIIELTKFDSNEAVTSVGLATTYAGEYGFKTDNVGVFSTTVMPRFKNFKIQKTDLSPYVDPQAGAFVMMALHAANSTSVINEETELAIFRFKAKAQGQTGLAFSTTYAAESYPVGQKFMIPTAILDITPDFGKLSVGQEPISAPTVTISNKVISWNAVSEAAGYNLKITIERDSGKTETVVNNITDTTYTLDAGVIGKVTAEVSAIAASDEKADSEYAKSNSEEYKVTLSKPSISWDGKKLKWDAVDNVLGYEVVLYEGPANTEIHRETVTTNSIDLNSKIKNPTTTAQNVYKATVQAVGDSYALNSDIAEIQKITYGNVAVPTNLGWDGYKATWTASADSEFISEYIISLYDAKGHLTTVTTTATLYDFASYIKDKAGVYHYEIYADGKVVDGGEYGNSNLVISPDKTEKVNLNPVSNVNWNERELSWTSDNTFKGDYEITVYKWNVLSDKYDQVGVYTTSDTKYDFNSIIAEGKYKVSIIAKGDTYIYLDSAPVEDEENFIVQLSAPGSLNLDASWQATWASVTGAQGYEIALKLNGKAIIKSDSVPAGTTQYDFTQYTALPGTYTFEIKAIGDGINFSTSIPAVSNSQIKVISAAEKKGKLDVAAYAEDTLASGASSVSVGSSFYVAITLDNDSVADYNLTAYNLPVKFDPAVVKVADANGMAVTSGVYDIDALNENGILIQENGFVPVSNDTYVEIDNEKGLIKFLAQSTSAVTISAPTKLLVIKFVAAAKATSSEIRFADSNDSVYDGTAPSGAQFTYGRTYIFPDDTTAKATFAVTKGQLPVPTAPVFSESSPVLNWKAVGGAIGYEIELYKDTQKIATVNVDNGEQISIDLGAYISGVGTYKAKIKAIGDGVEADSSVDFSPLSNDYIVAGSGESTPSGSVVGTLPGVTPSKPSTGDKEKVEFIDIEGHWAEENIIELEEYKIIEGYGDKTFRPDFGITRAEFTKMMVMALGLEVKENAENNYIDTESHWSRDYVAVATEAGIVNGIGEDMFAPDVIITREQMSAIIWRIADKVEAANDSTYADKAAVSQYAQTAVEFVTDKGYMIGFEDNTFRPTEQTNRAQAATVILRLIKSGFFKAN